MNENLKLFLEKLMDDEALAAKFGACKSEDEAYAIASAVQDGFTKEELVETMDAIYRANNSGDLSKEDLATVAGGVDSLLTLTTSMASACSAFLGASAAI